MNRIYRTVWNEVRRAFVAVAENARSRGKRSGGAAVAAPAATLVRPLALEARFMFDGAAVATAAEAAVLPEPLPEPAAPPAATGGAQQRQEIAFIDTAVKDWTLLRDGVRDGVEVVLLDRAQDGVLQMAQALEGRSGIDAIHVLSHGSEGRLFLGNAVLDRGTAETYAAALERIGSSLTADGDLLLYGCDIASADDAQLIHRLAALTQADVAASDDATGLGADWDLEVATAQIEAEIVLRDEAIGDYLWQLAVPADGVYTFAGATDGDGDGIWTTADGFFNIEGVDGSGRNADVSADQYGAFINDTATGSSYTSYIEVRVASGGSFYLTDATIGDFNVGAGNNNDFQNVHVVGYAGGTAVAQTAPIDSVGVFQAEYPIDYSPLSGVLIDSFRVYYTTTTTTQQVAFNLESFMLQGASTTAVNAPPALDANGAGGGTTHTTAFTEDGGAIRIVTSDATLTDDDNLTGMTLVLGAAPNGGSEGIAYSASRNGGASLASLGLTGSYNSATRAFTLSGTASAAVYQGVLRAMVYYNTSQAPDTTARTVTISATDAEGATGQTTVSIDVTALNDAPSATNLTQSKAVTEGGGSVALDDIVVTDADGADTITATLTLSNPAAGTLGTGTFGSATSTYNAATGVWTVTGSVSDVNAALAAVALTPSADNDQNFTVTTRVRDAAGTGPADGTISVTVTAVNDAPTATNLTQSKSATEGGSAVALDDIVVSDVDTGETITATLTLSHTAAGSLSSGTFGSATSTYNAGTGVWTVTGSVPDVNAALAAVALTPSADNDQNFTITTRVRDAADTGPADGTITVTVTGVNDAPTATNLTQTVTYTEDPGGSLALGDIVVSDVDTGDTITATLALSNAAAGTLTTGTFGSATSTYDAGTGVWTVSGSVPDVNAALAAVAFSPAANWDQDVTIATHIEDGAGAGPADGTITLDVTPVNDAPAGADNTITVAEDTDYTFAAADFGFSDIDGGSFAAVTIASIPLAGSLTLDGVAVTAGQRVVKADIDAGKLRFTPAANANGAGYASFTFQVEDDGGTANGGVDTDQSPNTMTLDVTAVNDAPTAAGLPAVWTVFEDVPTAHNLAGVTFSDVDAGSGSVTVAFTASAGTLGANAGSVVTVGGIGSGTLTLTGSIADIHAYLGSETDIYYTGAANASGAGAATVTVTINDNGNTGSGGGTPVTVATITVNITAANDAPVLTGGGTLGAVDEDTANPAGAALNTLGIAADDTADGGSITGYAIVGNAANAASEGTWQYSTDSGASWHAIGAVGDGANALALSAPTLVRFVPAANFNGAPGALTLRALDDSYAGGFTAGGTRVLVDTTTNGDDSAISAATASIATSITAVNDAPTADASHGYVNAGASTETGGLVAISGAVLHEGDPDDSGSGVTYTVTTATTGGTLFLDANGNGVVDGGEALGATDTFTQDDIDLGRVKYLHGGGAGTSDSFTFSVADGGEDGAAVLTGQTFSFTIEERPVVAIGAGAPSHTEDGAATAIAPGLTITDGDSPDMTGATVTITDFVAGDVLGFTNQNGITGSYNAATGVLTLSGAATRAQYEAALRSVTYATTSDNPATGAGNGDRIMEFRVSDHGGLQSVAGVTQTVAVANANDAPVLDATQSPALNGVAEDAAAPVNGSTAGSTLVSALLGGASDVDTGALQGIALVGVSTQGTLWYSTDGGTTWTQAPAVSAAGALLLQSDARVYFQPGANVNGAIADAVTFRAWDRTSGANGGTADTTANGGGTAFSTATDTASVSVTAVNDAPTVNAGPHALTGTDENTTSAGDTVAAILTGLGHADVDAGALGGIALTGTTGNGTWQYSTDGGATWLGVGAVSGAGALLLDASASLRYVPDGENGETGAAAPSLSLRAWDRTSGTATVGATRSTADVSTNGGATAYSATLASATLQVSAVNDAPAATNLTQTVSYTEDPGAAVALGDIVISDVDTGETVTATLTLSNAAAGSLSTGTFGAATSSFNAGVWTVTGSVADVNAALAAVAFTPAANWDQDVTLTTRIRDAAGAGPADGTITLDVTAVNDAPTLANAIADQNAAEDAVFSFTLPANTFADVDTGDVLTYSAQLGGGGALPVWLSFDAATRTFSGTPANGDVGAFTVRVTATDSGGLAVDTTFDVTVANTNDAPAGAVTISGTVLLGNTLSVSHNLSDEDGMGAVSYQWQAGDGASWTDIAGASGTQLQIDGTLIGKSLRVVASYTDARGTAEAVASQPTGGVLFVPPPVLPEAAPVMPALPPPAPLPAREAAAAPALPSMTFLPAGSEVGLFGAVAVSGPQSEALLSEGLFVARGMPDVQMPPGGEGEIRVPADAFTHTDPHAVVVLQATLADGRPLPGWIAFDPSSGTFRVAPPPGLEQALEVRVIARDSQGREAVFFFTIEVGGEADAPPAPSSGLEGRSGLNEQLRMAARPLGVSERLLALSRAAQAAQRTRG